jgi:carbon-monoxide dehydrogenase small subunit
MTTHEIELTVDGNERTAVVEPRTLLVHALRDELGYTGPKVGCESSRCGACTVELDGRAVKSCTVLGVQADGGAVRTAASLAEGDRLGPLQVAFREEHGTQCGYCTPGMLMTSADLLAEDPDPDREAIRHALEGNLCRCTGYQGVVDAVEAAAEAYPTTARESETSADAPGSVSEAEWNE